MEDGVSFLRSFSGLYQHAAGTSAPLSVYLQDRLHLSQQLSVPRSYPASISAVVRTASVWVDRVKVRVAYQLKDAMGSPLVSRPAAVRMLVTLGVSSSGPHSCNTALTQSSGQLYVAYCSLNQLSSSWFEASAAGSASVTVTLRDSTNSADVDVAQGSLTVVQQPTWYDAGLRSATTGSGLTAPADHGLSGGGIFVTLPVSPVYAGERFDVYLYAHTGGYSLNSMTLSLYYSSTLLQYVSYAQTSHFNGAVFDRSQAGRLAWVITGRSNSASAGDVTGTAIYLMRVTMQFSSGTAAGSYGSTLLGLYPFAQTLVNNGNLAFVEDGAGPVYCRLDTAQTRGEMEVRQASTVGIFASYSAPVFFNAALLDGVTRSYSATVAAVSSSDLSNTATSSISPSGCSIAAPAVSPLSFSLSSSTCEVTVGETHEASGLSSATLEVSAAGFTATAGINVYAPASIALSLDDDTLNRFNDVDGGQLPSSCGSSAASAFPYQRTRALTTVDGLDASPLVQYTTSDGSVASIGSGEAWDIVQGTGVGTAIVALDGRQSSPSVAISVTDELVSITTLTARVVTSLTWSSAPSPLYTLGSPASAGVLLQQVLRAEGDSGFLYAMATYSDGTIGHVGYTHMPGMEELVVATDNPSVSAVSPTTSGQQHWQLGVAVGATAERVSDVFVNWTVCGSVVASSYVPLLLDLPNPTAVSLSMAQSRLTDPDDDATRSPLSVPSTSMLTVLVSYDDGSQRDMSTDSRVS